MNVYRKTVIRRILISWLLGSFMLSVISVSAEETEIERAGRIEHVLLRQMELDELDKELESLTEKQTLSFSELVTDLMSGKMPWEGRSWKDTIKDLFLAGWKNERKMAGYILAMIIAGAVFQNFTRVFDKSRISEVSSFLLYLLFAALLMKVYSGMSETTVNAVNRILELVRLLLPSCLAAVYLCSGSLTVMGTQQIMLTALSGMEWLMRDCLLPLVRVYMLFVFLNHMMQEDYLSKLTDLIATVIRWGMKTAVAVLFGMQALQCLIVPSADRLKNSTLRRLISMIPGIGDASEGTAGMVLSAACVLKNAVGAAGIIMILLAAAVPVCRLAAGVFLYRFLGAAAQPVSDKRIGGCISGLSDAGELLLKILIYELILFVVSLGLMVALIGGSAGV